MALSAAAAAAAVTVAVAVAGTEVVQEPALFFSLGFSSRSVLPREPASAVVYGGGAAGALCTGVQLVLRSGGGAVVSTVTAGLVGRSGSWSAHLPPVAAGSGYSLTATCSSGGVQPVASQWGTPETVELTDVAFGDLLLCTGQSNM